MADVLYMVIGYYLEDILVNSVFEDRTEAEAHAMKLNRLQRQTAMKFYYEVEEIPFKKKKHGK